MKNVQTSRAAASVRMALLGIAVTALLAGCASPEQIAAGDRQTCTGYGFAQGTDAFATCMMQADTRRKKATADWLAEQNKPKPAAAAVMPSAPMQERCKTTESTVSMGNAMAPGGAMTQSHSTSTCSSF